MKTDWKPGDSFRIDQEGLSKTGVVLSINDTFLHVAEIVHFDKQLDAFRPDRTYGRAEFERDAQPILTASKEATV